MDKNVEYELTKLERKKRKFLTVGIIVAIVLIIILAIFVKGYSAAIAELEAEVERLSDPVVIYEEASREVDIRVINAEIQDIGELATIEYLYTDAGKFEDPKQLFGKNIPFTTKSFIAKWDGCIKAGVVISQVTAELNRDDKEIIVHIPKAEILSHEIDENSIETLDQKDGLFNPVKVDDVREFDAISKKAMEERAIENGILDKAFENAKEIIAKLINNDAVQELDYTITFEVIE
ncbi:MAG: DUF4230 domain-containing protein [Lachnospiraceae bacterium]